MPIIVVCPKCAKRQEVGAQIPPEGLKYGCKYCQAPFLVRLPRPLAPASDLPAPRNLRPDDLPASRGPTDLPAPALDGRDLPAPALGTRDLPAPGRRDLPAPKGSIPLGGAAAPAAGPDDLGLDLLAPDSPAGSGSPLEPLELDLPDRGPPLGMDAPEAPLKAPPGLDLSLGDPDFGPGGAAGGVSAGLDLIDEALGPPPPGAAAAAAAPPPASAGSPDLGFSLRLEGPPPSPAARAVAAAHEAAVMPRPPGSKTPPPQPNVPALAPVTARSAPTPPPKVARRRRWPLRLGLAAVLAAAAVGAGVVFVLPMLEGGPRPEKVLGPLAAELARDHYPAYQRAGDRLAEEAAKDPEARTLRAAAATQWLLAALGRGGDRAKVTRADQLLAEIPAEGKPDPSVNRARALLAVARNKPKAVDELLGPDRESPDAQLVVGLAKMAEAKPAAALEAFRRFASAHPEAVLGAYLVARALEQSKPAEARAAYDQVIAKNPEHFGARVALVRLTESSGEALEAALGLVTMASPPAGPGEVADAHVAAGRAAQALGRTADAVGHFSRALALDGQNVAANLALGEAFLLDGKADQALARFRALAPAAQRTAAARFGLGGALVATGKTEEGMALVKLAAEEAPSDPRLLYWTGVAAELATPPDQAAAAEKYRAALAKDRRFVAASLKLASLLQRQGKADEAIAVLQEAEQAGAPPTTLQMAFGEALISAGEPARAEEVFRKALAVDANLLSARLGLSAALAAQDNLAGARQELERTRTELPDAMGVRERLAQVLIKLGDREAALRQYQEEVATGKAGVIVRVGLAKLALEMGNLDLAETELDKVIEESPGAPEALFTRARLYEARDDTARALQEYRRALVFEQSPALHLAYGRALAKMGKEENAATEFEAASSLAEARVERGILHARRGFHDRALAEFEAGAKLDPHATDPLLWQGKALDKMGQRDRAAEAWRAVIKLAPEHSEAHFHLGRLEMDKGNAKAALEHLRKSAWKLEPKTPWEPELLFQLGTAELQTGNRKTAVTVLKKYLTLVPADAPTRPEVERQLAKLGGN